MDIDPVQFGEYLRKLRTDKNLTLVDVYNACGVSQPYLSQIENGKAFPSPDILKKLSGPLGIDYSELMEKAGYMTSHKIINEIELIEAWFYSNTESAWAQDLKFVLGTLTDENHQFIPYAKKQIEDVLKDFLKLNFGESFELTPKSLIDLCKKVDFEDLDGDDIFFHSSAMELLTIMKSLAMSTVDETKLESIIGAKHVTFCNVPLDEKERHRILEMLYLMFPDRISGDQN